jgi:hypothetical protein
MAKKQLKDYKFFPGIIPPAYGEYPTTVDLLTANKSFIVAEMAAYLSWASNTPSTPGTLYPNAAGMLTTNKEFIKEEAAAWIQVQINTSQAPFTGYTYTPTIKAKCKRDIGYLLDAWIADLSGGGNAETYRYARQYYLNGEAQLISPVQEAAVYAFVKNLIQTNVLPRVAFTTNQSPVIQAQVTTGTSGEAGGITKVGTLIDTVANVIDVGLAGLPTISYNYNALYVGYTFDANKCNRDTEYVIDSYIYDLTYGGNSLTYYVASRYYINGVIQVNNPQVEVTTQTFVRNLITTYVLANYAHANYQTGVQQVLGDTPEAAGVTRTTTLANYVITTINSGLSALPAVVAPDSQNGNVLPNAVALLELNKKFIQEEAMSYIQYNVNNNISPFVFFTYNVEKCRRDVSYILEGYISDLKHGGNRQTIFNASKYWENGIAQVDGDRSPEIAAHTFIRDLIENYIFANVLFGNRQIVVSQVIDNGNPPEAPSNTRIKELSNTVLDVIANGVAYLPTKVSNRGYLKVPGFYKLKDFLLITNTTRNVILYNFADVASAGEVTYSENYDSDFPGALYGVDKITTITFDVDTGYHMVTDQIQVFVEGKEQAVRLNPIATDAMERMKVGIPQSMLDADFEYGLQPTKWQALALMRNYPSIYEIPGSDLAVTNVVTDASTGTAGIGASLITVTTQSSHGFAVGDPITIKALANSISGFSRAEGSFLVASTPAPNTFTYYAKSKVGSSNGQVLASTYTQLRRGGFYTNSSVGNASFSVYSSGSSGTVTTSLVTPAGTDVIGFTGTIPPVGAPITGTGLTAGAQVSAVAGNGGTVTSTQLVALASVSATQVTVVDTTGIQPGLVFDRGDGQAVVVTDITGNVVSLSGALTSTVIGTTQSYATLSQTSTNGAGTGAIFTVSRSGSTYSTTVTDPGSRYVAGNTVTIAGVNVGGTTPTNNVTVTVATASPKDTVSAFDNATLLGGTGYTSNQPDLPTTSSGTGSGLTVDTTTSAGGVTAVAINSAGTNYDVGDTITIGPTGRVSGVFVGSGIGSGYTDATNVLTSGGSGTGLTLDIITDTNNPGIILSVSINTPGQGYSLTDTGITITQTGSNNSATVDINTLYTEATIQVLTVNAGGLIQSVTTTGTPVTAPTKNFISAFTVSEVTTNSIASGNTGLTYSAIGTIQVTFTSPHGFIPGNTITTFITSGGTGSQLAAGPFFVEQVPDELTLRYTARTAGAIDNNLVGIVYGRPDSFFIHRPFDGGVQLGTASPSHGATAIRMSKKYIRYQSGKGVMYNTGALFAPSYDIRAMTATGTAVGSVITLQTDDTDHGCQVGGGVTISGSITPGYNGNYIVSDIVNERQLKVIAYQTLGDTTAVLGSPCQMGIRTWHGSTIRAGIFDDQNGMFWQYDGMKMAVVRRSSTNQIAGTIAIAANSNSITGNNTRFTQQLAAGDRIVIRGMTHVVSRVIDDTSMTVTPDYRGVNNIAEAKCVKTTDIVVPQESWNLDPLNGSGPSGYNLDPTKMQMIGLQHTWYGAGFIDFMLRGADGNYCFAHRFRNSNVNTEAYMRTGNQPVRYEVINEGAKGKLNASMDAVQTTIPMSADDLYWFPSAGTVMIDNELIRFTGNSGTTLTGCVRAASLSQFVAGSQRNFTGGVATTHSVRTGVILVSNTITPNISHWGSAFMIDGQFDSDRGYIFNYAATGINAGVDKNTAFLIRLAPSVSNAQVGDLGEKELLNRAQLLLSGISITSDPVVGGGAIVVEGVLNPANYPTDPTKITWTGLASSAAGGQPSFAQIASGGSVTWAGNTFTTNATVQGAFTTTLTAKSFAPATNNLTATAFSTVTQNLTATSFSSIVSPTYANALSTGRSDFLIPTTQYDSLTTRLNVGDTLSVATFITAGQKIAGITRAYITLNSISYTRIIMTANANATSSTGSGFNITVVDTCLLSQTYASALSASRTDFLMPQTQYAVSTLATSDVLSVATYLTSGQGVASVTPNYTTIANVAYARIIMTSAANSTSTAGTGNNFTVVATSAATATYGSAVSASRLDFLITDASYSGSGIAIGDTLSLTTFITGSQTITAITPTYINISGTNYTRIIMSAVGNSTSTAGGSQDQTVTVTASGSAASYASKNFLFFTSSSWLASGAAVGTKVATSITQFPAGTSVAQISTRTFGATTVYRVTFTQTANTSIAAAATITFQFGSPYATPGEQVFSFIANPGDTAELSLDALKELTSTAIGGRGTFPNGPDVLAINVYKVSGTGTPCNVILRWGEAQA